MTLRSRETMATNPYNWQVHRPQVQIPRPDVDLVAKTLLNNGSSVVLGGRGMGKSVFLAQLKGKLENEPGTKVVLFVAPAARLTVQSCLNRLARRLGVAPEDDALVLASGGIPALLTYGLQELWNLDRVATAQDVTRLYKSFEAHHGEYLRDLLSALTDKRLSDAPARVWEHIQENAGRIPRADLEQALGKPSGVLQLNLVDVLHLLEAVGVVRLESSAYHDNPLTLHPIPSLLNLPRNSPVKDDLREDFLRARR
jgi:hypothetical protein